VLIYKYKSEYANIKYSWSIPVPACSKVDLFLIFDLKAKRHSEINNVKVWCTIASTDPVFLYHSPTRSPSSDLHALHQRHMLYEILWPGQTTPAYNTRVRELFDTIASVLTLLNLHSHRQETLVHISFISVRTLLKFVKDFITFISFKSFFLCSITKPY